MLSNDKILYYIFFYQKINITTNRTSNVTKNDLLCCNILILCKENSNEIKFDPLQTIGCKSLLILMALINAWETTLFEHLVMANTLLLEIQYPYPYWSFFSLTCSHHTLFYVELVV